MLVAVEGHDLHLALVANSEFEIGLGDSSGVSKWNLNEVSLEQQIGDRQVFFCFKFWNGSNASLWLFSFYY
jgi:hypothetical protein